jgi:hypothetical protein
LARRAFRWRGSTGPARISRGIGIIAPAVLHNPKTGAAAFKYGLQDVVPLLKANLAQEEATDKKLTQLAQAQANAKGQKVA